MDQCLQDRSEDVRVRLSGIMLSSFSLDRRLRRDKKLDYNPKKMEVTNSPEANRLLRKDTARLVPQRLAKSTRNKMKFNLKGLGSFFVTMALVNEIQRALYPPTTLT